jgi:hypothetical protein
MRKPGYLAAYAKARGISHVAMRKQLIRAGVNYLEPFDWKVADRLLDGARHLVRDSYRLREVRNPYV